jgi:hypothetical protein
VRFAALVVVLAGCFAKPARPDVDPGDGGVDAPPCMAANVSDNFDDTSGQPCGAGFEDGDPISTVTRRDGVLQQAPGTTDVSNASCTWGGVVFDRPVFVEVRSVLGPGGTYTILQLDAAGSSVGMAVTNDAQARLEAFDDAQPGSTIRDIPYDPVEMRWWRLRPDGGNITSEYSPDGLAWTHLATTSVSTAPTDTDVSLNGGTFAILAAPGVAEFDNFDVCP